MVDSSEGLGVVFLEFDPPAGKLGDVRFDVGRPEAHLGVVGFVPAAAAVDQQCRAAAAIEEEMVCDRLGRQRRAAAGQ